RVTWPHRGLEVNGIDAGRRAGLAGRAALGADGFGLDGESVHHDAVADGDHVPGGGGEPAEGTVPGGFGVRVEILRIVGAGKGDDLVLGEGVGAEGIGRVGFGVFV